MLICGECTPHRGKKKQKSTWCSAATIDTILRFVRLRSGKFPTQSKIMQDWKTYWTVTYPDLPLMRNHLRDKVKQIAHYILNQHIHYTSP